MRRRTFIQSLGVTGMSVLAANAMPSRNTMLRSPIPDDPSVLLVDLVDAAMANGATYADARFILFRSEAVSVRKTTLYSVLHNETAGIALRAYKGGNWGYAALSDLRDVDVRRMAMDACSMAASLGAVQSIPFHSEGRITTAMKQWSTPYKVEPFDVSLNEKTDFLLGLSTPPLEKVGIEYTVANLFSSKKRVLYANSLGGTADQTYVVTYPNFGITAFNQKKGRIDSRNSDIEPLQTGWEVVNEYGFERELVRAVNEVLEKNEFAKPIEPMGYDLIVTSSHLWKIFYDTLAAQIDPYAVYSLDGESPANRMFAPNDVGSKQFSSGLLNVDGLTSLPRGLATTQIDDAGRPANTGAIVKKGVLHALPSSDELAGLVENRNGHSTRGESWDQEPKFAMPNLLIHPGKENLTAQDLASDVTLGLLVSGRSQTILSADRKSFRTTGQMGWLIENGKMKHMVRDFVYEASTSYFWNMLDALGGPDTVTLGGDMYPQNNSAIWMSPFSIAAPSARFTNISVFSLAGGVK